VDPPSFWTWSPPPPPNDAVMADLPSFFIQTAAAGGVGGVGVFTLEQLVGACCPTGLDCHLLDAILPLLPIPGALQ